MDTHQTAAGTYAKVLGALLALTVTTVLAAGFNFGSWNVVIALGIATIKASLVALFFMHLRWEKPVNSIIAVAGFLFLGIFLMFDLIDADSRNYYLPQNLHRTEVPLTPGTAPAALTEILPETPAAGSGAPAAPAPGAAPAAASTPGTTPEGEKK